MSEATPDKVTQTAGTAGASGSDAQGTGGTSAGASGESVEEKKKDVLAEHILRAAGLSGDDLMAFQHVFGDAATSLCARLAQYTSATFTVEVKSLDTLKADALPNIITGDTLVVRFEADRWGGDVLFVLDANLVGLMTDAFFGAAEPAILNRNGRPFSPVETKTGETSAKILSLAMDDVFGNGDGTLFNFKQTIDAQQFDMEEFEQLRMFSCLLSVKSGEVETTLNILMPRSCHRPIQEAVTRVLRAPSTRTDPLWAKRLRQEVSRAHVAIEAYILQGSMTLNDLLHIEVGQVLPLPANAVKQVRLRSGDKPLYKCSLGKVGSNFSVRVTEPIDEEEEMYDELVHN
ncbi:FliM/FliN family flagellar motor switch protein [uncultured Bartonella sp.]|uniref:FliM/FliN family flagellar motor switch protein n=1 Tax=uncultured Bartonella sp. TaxID=104108 RepID=UPI0025FE2DBD|nr:FliM/FliN family flagellar motor switch protein [uncultured Bartonella sp.]